MVRRDRPLNNFNHGYLSIEMMNDEGMGWGF
jgi:hypothetical protein